MFHKMKPQHTYLKIIEKEHNGACRARDHPASKRMANRVKLKTEKKPD